MRVTQVDAIPVRITKIAPSQSALGVRIESCVGIVIIETDTGLRGLREISMSWNGEGAGLCPMVKDLLGPTIIGISPYDIHQALAKMNETVQFSPAANPAQAAIVKAKVGGDPQQDPEVVTAIWKAVGDRVVIRIDASMG